MFRHPHPFSIDDPIEFNTRTKVFDFPAMSIYRIADTSNISAEQTDRLLSRLELQLQIKRGLSDNEGPVLLQLSKITSKIGPPTDKYCL